MGFEDLMRQFGGQNKSDQQPATFPGGFRALFIFPRQRLFYGGFMNAVKKRHFIYGLFLTLSMTIASSVYSQISDENTHIDTNLVLVDVLIIDKSGKPVSGLTADQFELFNDNVKQPIEVFSAEAAPVSFGIVFDMHPTTTERNKAVVESLSEFRKGLGAEDDIFLLAFDMRGQHVFDFVPTLEQLERHMAGPERRQMRSLYDAVYFASNKIQSSRNQKRILLIISDRR